MEGAFASDQEDVDGLNPGTYLVEVTDANGCSIQLIDIVVETIVGVTEFGDEWSIRVYPNPAMDYVTVELPVVNAALTVELYDATGRLIWQQTAASNGRFPDDSCRELCCRSLCDPRFGWNFSAQRKIIGQPII